MMDKRKEITSIDKSVSKFKTLIKSGPVFVFVVCNRCPYQKHVILLKMHRYNVDEDSIFRGISCNSTYYICNTCDKALQNNRIPCQAAWNTLFAEDLPMQFQGINRLERLLASTRILFKKVTVMPKSKSLKIKGSICDIPVTEVNVNCNTLPRPADSNGLLIVKLKRKLEYKSHVILEAVRAALVVQFLKFLMLHT